MSYRTRFLVASSGWAVVVTAALLAGAVAVRDRLPDPMASHWGLSGAPDDAAPAVVLLVVDLVLWLAIAGSAVALAARGGQR
ncbi:DUF1648 domain-containing protein, partial [Saccharopolyspora hordei]